MTKRFQLLKLLPLAAIAFAIAAGVAHAGPDDSGYAVIDEDTGFPNVCDAPCYSIGKSFEFWLHDNLDNPKVSALADNHTYVYKLEHLGGASTIFVPGLIGFSLDVDDTNVTEAGHIIGSPGVTPSATQILTGRVQWDFLTAPVASGETSALLYIHSPLLPGTTTDNIVGAQGQLSLDASGTCKGPFVAPPDDVCSLQVDKSACVVQPPDVPGDTCQGKVKSFCFEYTGLGCAASSNLQNPKKVRCIGGAAGEDPVSIIVVGKKKKRWGWNRGWWGKKKRKKTVFASESQVHVGDIICADAANAGKHTVGSQVYVKISNGTGGHHDILEIDKFHTSCSQPFDPGNQFGSLLMTSITTTVGTNTIPDPEVDGSECISEIDVVPGPHCEGKVTSLSLRYTGSDCASTMHSQNATKVGCWDAAAPTANPVRVIVGDSASSSSNWILDQSPVAGGEIVVVIPAGSQLKSVTGFWIKDAVTGELIQDGFFHTSCSQQLNLGDQIGSLQVFGMTTTNGGTVALGSDVEYTYTVTNANPDQAVNVSVDDDLLGNIASGETIPPNSSVDFSTNALIEVETTNIATVTGSAGPAGTTVCMEGTDSATITVAEPPDEPTVCTKKIAAALFRYTGPDRYGVTVEFSAKSFKNDPVVYGPVDLIGGVTVLSSATENGYTIDGTAHGETDLGSKLTVRINGCDEILHTSCSAPFATDAPAPLNDPKGDPSSLWFVLDFAQKQ